MTTTELTLPLDEVTLAGDLTLPEDAGGVVLFAHGSGSSRHSPRNRQVAVVLNDASFGTLLLDLLTEDEEAIDLRTGELRFDIALLARRVIAATDWLSAESETATLPIGYFGASTGAAAALVAAAERPDAVGAIVSRGGRPDLAGEALGRVRAPTLLIVGGEDSVVIPLNGLPWGSFGSKRHSRSSRAPRIYSRSPERSNKSPSSHAIGSRGTSNARRRARGAP